MYIAHTHVVCLLRFVELANLAFHPTAVFRLVNVAQKHFFEQYVLLLLRKQQMQVCSCEIQHPMQNMKANVKI